MFYSGEETACKYLQKKGWQFLANNYQKCNAEIDLIFYEKKDPIDVIHFVEVKRWKHAYREFHPLHSLNKKKIARYYRAAEIFLQDEEYQSKVNTSFDLLFIHVQSDTESIHFYEACF